MCIIGTAYGREMQGNAMKNSSKDIKTLTTDIFTANSSSVLANPYYAQDERILIELFKQYPSNKKSDHIFHKIVMVDFIYSTQLKRLIGESGIHDLAQRISEINFDSRIKIGDTTLVNEIAGATSKNLFSFASKYCALHNRFVSQKDDYSIYDRTVAKLFSQYTKLVNKVDSSIVIVKEAQIEKWRKAKSYQEFNDAIGEFLDKCNISELDFPNRRMKFDEFLWNQR